MPRGGVIEVEAAGAVDREPRLEAFEERCNFTARPFNWRYIKKDLDALSPHGLSGETVRRMCGIFD